MPVNKYFSVQSQQHCIVAAVALLSVKLPEYNKQDNFRGDLVKERNIKKALYDILKDDVEVERIFQIIVNQKDY